MSQVATYSSSEIDTTVPNDSFRIYTWNPIVTNVVRVRLLNYYKDGGSTRWGVRLVDRRDPFNMELSPSFDVSYDPSRLGPASSATEVSWSSGSTNLTSRDEAFAWTAKVAFRLATLLEEGHIQFDGVYLTGIDELMMDFFHPNESDLIDITKDIYDGEGKLLRPMDADC